VVDQRKHATLMSATLKMKQLFETKKKKYFVQIWKLQEGKSVETKSLNLGMKIRQL
jgi:hypothetical protein